MQLTAAEEEKNKNKGDERVRNRERRVIGKEKENDGSNEREGN